MDRGFKIITTTLTAPFSSLLGVGDTVRVIKVRAFLFNKEDTESNTRYCDRFNGEKYLLLEAHDGIGWDNYSDALYVIDKEKLNL